MTATTTTKPYHLAIDCPDGRQITFGNDLPFCLIAGPCVLESRDHALTISSRLRKISETLNIPLIYKSSFDKANRTSLSAVRGLGIDESMRVFEDVKRETGLPILTDVHEASQCQILAETVDILQIPAFLCRQTDLLLAAAQTGLAINVKKGQFLAPWDMKNVIAKITNSGNQRVMACERGASFGYNTLVTDFRGLPIMARECDNKPIIFDATHSVQQPGGLGGASGGQREFVPYLAKAAVSVGVAGLFMETHQDPDNAPSDGPNMWPLDQLEPLLATLMRYDQITKG